MEWKKSIALGLAVLVSLSACSSGQQVPPTGGETSGDESAVSESIAPVEGLGELEVDEGIFNVEITIPADFLEEGITQADLDAEAEEAGFKSITLNEDGSATYVMTRSQHDKMMQGIADSIDQSLLDLVDSEDYPTFVDAKANDDYTEFTITTTSNELGLNEAFSTFAFYVYGGMYNTFNGTPVDDIVVMFVNSDTGDIIHEAHSSEME